MTLRINDNGTDRDMTTDEEIAHLEYAKVLQTEAKAKAKADKLKADTRQTILDRLGITNDELLAILS